MNGLVIFVGAVLLGNPGYGGATLPQHRFDNMRQCLEERHNYADEPSRADRRRGAFLECVPDADEGDDE